MCNLQTSMMKLVLVICLAILIPGCVENPYKPGSIEQINITGTVPVPVPVAVRAETNDFLLE